MSQKTKDAKAKARLAKHVAEQLAVQKHAYTEWITQSALNLDRLSRRKA